MNTDMKKYILLQCCLPMLLFASCRNQDYIEADYNVRLAQTNTYRAGEPVKFEIIGNVDNLLFYSGETGHEYRYHDRYIVAPEDVLEAEFSMSIRPLYGYEGALDIYVSDSFDGLGGEDPEADRAAIREMYAAGMPGWVHMADYEDIGMGPDGWTLYKDYVIDLKDYVDKCSIALHWHPGRTNPETQAATSQRTYWINADLVTNFGQGTNSINIRNIEWVSVMMNSYYDDDPYVINKGNGYVNFNFSGADLILQGCSNTELDFDIDAWIISEPMALTAVQNDQPLVIKDMQNYMTSYEYTWNEPGTYVVTFVGINTNYAGESQLNKEFKITIL